MSVKGEPLRHTATQAGTHCLSGSLSTKSFTGPFRSIRVISGSLPTHILVLVVAPPQRISIRIRAGEHGRHTHQTAGGLADFTGNNEGLSLNKTPTPPNMPIYKQDPRVGKREPEVFRQAFSLLRISDLSCSATHVSFRWGLGSPVPCGARCTNLRAFSFCIRSK